MKSTWGQAQWQNYIAFMPKKDQEEAMKEVPENWREKVQKRVNGMMSTTNFWGKADG